MVDEGASADCRGWKLREAGEGGKRRAAASSRCGDARATPFAGGVLVRAGEAEVIPFGVTTGKAASRFTLPHATVAPESGLARRSRRYRLQAMP